jgi:hypothetical protein
LTKEEKIKLIRVGNELFNSGKIEKAIKIFIHTDYKDGINRVADYYYYEEKKPLIAFNYYQKAGNKKMLDELTEKMAMVIQYLLLEDEAKVN